MLEAYIKIFPIIATFLLGYSLKKIKVFKPEDGGLLLKILFFVVAPALVYLSSSTVEITSSFLTFPLIATLTLFSLYFLNVVFTRSFKVSRTTLGVYFIGTLIANTGFALPFLYEIAGVEAVSRLAMYDLAGGGINLHICLCAGSYVWGSTA